MYCRKINKPSLGWCLKIIILLSPLEPQPPGMQGVVGQDETLPLLIRQPAFH